MRYHKIRGVKILDFYDLIIKIIEQGRQEEAINMLAKSMAEDISKLRCELSEKSSCLKAIRKINKGKNEEIDNLTY